MSIDKILDRVRKLLSLSEHSGSEHEAALAASRAALLMEQYQLSEALVRLDDANAKPEPILRDERLEPNTPLTGRKRVAWKETISHAVAKDLGVREYYRYNMVWTGHTMRRTADVRGLGRETAIQTWRYTCEYLWRTVDELADKAWLTQGDDESSMGAVRAWKNSFRIGCASKISERIFANRKVTRETAKAVREAAIKVSPNNDRESMALSIIERDQAEVDAEYTNLSARWGGRNAASIGSTSNYNGYDAGRAAGDRVSLGGKRAALGAGQGRLKP